MNTVWMNPLAAAASADTAAAVDGLVAPPPSYVPVGGPLGALA